MLASVSDDRTPGAERAAPPPRAQRRKILRWLGLFVLVQLFVPLTYYLRDDPYDERFAWRMFSAVRLHRCQTSAVERRGDDETPIELTRVLHRAWVNHLSRNRRDVVRAFLRKRCEKDGVSSVVVRNDCVAPDGTALAPQIYERDCGSGEVEEPGALTVAEPSR